MGFVVFWLLVWILGAVAIVVLASHFKAPPAGAFVVSLGFAFSGVFTGHAEHTPILYAVVFFLFALWRLDVGLTSDRIRPAIESGAIWGLSALGGYPQMTVLSGVFIFLWALGRWGCAEESLTGSVSVKNSYDSIRHLFFALKSVCAVLITGLLVLAPSYVGLAWETRGYTDRGIYSKELAIGSNAFHPGALATFASPYLSILKLYGNSSLWPDTDVSMASVYLGGLIVVLAVFAIIVKPSSRWRWWLIGIGTLFMACAVGKALPVRSWLYDVFVPSRYFRHPALFRVYAVIVIVILALLASKDIQEAHEAKMPAIWRKLKWTAVCISLLALLAYVHVLRDVSHLGNEVLLANFHFVLVWAGVILAALLLPKSTKVIGGIMALALADAILTFGLAQPTIYDTGLLPEIAQEIRPVHVPSLKISSFQRDSQAPAWLGPPVNNKNIFLKLQTFDNYLEFGNRFQLDAVRDPVLGAIATGSKRVWFSPTASEVKPDDSCYREYKLRVDTLGSPIIVVHRRTDMPLVSKPQEQPSCTSDAVSAIWRSLAARTVDTKLVTYGPDNLIFDVSAPTGGWALIADRWSPGWHAVVNSKSAEVWGGDFIFQALQVNAGLNRVELSYRPQGWPFLLIISWSTLFFVFAVLPLATHLSYFRKH